MKRGTRMILTVLLALVFVFSIARLLNQQQENTVGSTAYADALELATSEKTREPQPQSESELETVPPMEPQWVVASPEEEDPHIRELEDLDLEALRKVNPDVVGWIRIPDTEVDYPLMQGSDNDYYLNRTWDEQPNSIGSIFLEHLTSPDLTDFNTIIYGHNMSTGAMFGSLRHYDTLSYWEEHPYVYIRSDQGVYRYEIFSAYVADVESNTFGLAFPSENSMTKFLENALQDSVIDTGIQPEITDRILTLSTCSFIGYTHRWVVHARLKMVLQQPE